MNGLNMITIDWLAFIFLFLVGAFAYFFFSKVNQTEAIEVATLRFYSEKLTTRLVLRKLPFYFLLVTLFFFAGAILDIQWKSVVPNSPPTEGIAIYLTLDRSRSMSQKVIGGGSKFKMLQKISARFVKERPNDLIGLLAFARGTEIKVPLTLEHQALLDQLANLRFVDRLEEDGTAMGYALYKGAHLLQFVQSQELPYHIKSRVVLMVTDGIQDPHPKDAENALRAMPLIDAASYAKKLGVKCYLINVDPKMTFDYMAPHRHQMEKACSLTGGKVFFVDTPDKLEEVFKVINRLEKSPLWVVGKGVRVSMSPLFLLLGMLSFLLSIVLHTTYLRRFP